MAHAVAPDGDVSEGDFEAQDVSEVDFGAQDLSEGDFGPQDLSEGDFGAQDLSDEELQDDGPPDIEIVDELVFEGDIEESPSVREPELLQALAAALKEPAAEPVAASPADPFARLVLALEDAALALGAGDEALPGLRALFGQARLDRFAPGERAAEALLAGDVIARGARGFSRSSTFTGKVLAWQGILRGESEDFSWSGGNSLEPLDEWAADVLARVLGNPARADGIRRELRRRGIAAFGLVADAA